MSKQTFASAISHQQATLLLCRALAFLGQTPPTSLAEASPKEVLTWGIQHWALSQVPKLRSIVSEGDS